MLKQLVGHFFGGTIYVQLWEDRLKVINIKSGAEYDEPPFIALKENNKRHKIILAVGREAQALKNADRTEVINPFSHPRMLVANFMLAEKILLHSFFMTSGNKFFAPLPRVVIQPMEKLEGGLTDIETRVFRELCLGAGAREVVLYLGAPLSKNNFNFDEVKKLGV